MGKEEQNKSSERSEPTPIDQGKFGKKPIGLAGGQTGGQINGPTGSNVPDKRANPEENKQK